MRQSRSTIDLSPVRLGLAGGHSPGMVVVRQILLCFLVLMSVGRAFGLDPIDNFVKFTGTVSYDGQATWGVQTNSSLFQNDNFQIQNSIRVEETESGVRTNEGQLRFDLQLAPQITWVNGLNFYNEGELNSIDAQSGLVLEVGAIKGDAYVVGELTQEWVWLPLADAGSVVELPENQKKSRADGDLGLLTLEWRPNFNAGVGLSYVGENDLTGRVEFATRADYRSADGYADILFSLRSVIPAESEQTIDAEDILTPFITAESLLEGRDVVPIDGSWAWQLNYKTNGQMNVEAALNSSELLAGPVGLSLSVLQIAQWNDGALGALVSQAGTPLRVNFSPDTYISINPTVEYDWLAQAWGHSLAGQSHVRLSDHLALNLAAGYTAPGFVVEDVFARGELKIEQGALALSTFVSGQRSLVDTSGQTSVGVGVDYVFEEGLWGQFKGLKAGVSAQMDSKSTPALTSQGSDFVSRGFSVSVNVNAPF